MGRQDKWTRKFNGSFLVVSVPGPVNVVLQRSERSRPFCMHVDKVKPYIAEQFPKSWLVKPVQSGAPAPSHVTPAAEAPEAVSDDVEGSEIAAVPETATPAIAGVPSPQEYRSPRPRRHAGRPRRYLE